MAKKTKKWAALTAAVVLGFGVVMTPQMSQAAIKENDTNTVTGGEVWQYVHEMISEYPLGITNLNYLSVGYYADGGIGIGYAANGISGIALGQYSYVSDGTEGAVAIGDYSTVTENDTVSFGHKQGDLQTLAYIPYRSDYYRRLVNVADGINDHDVVTVGQLKDYVSTHVGTDSTLIYAGSDTINISEDKTISVKTEGAIAENNTGIVTGGTIWKYIKDNASGGTASASALAGNGLVATDDNKLAIDTSGGEIAENNTGFVTGGTIWKYIQDNAGSGSSAAIGDTTKLSDAGLADNVTDSILSVNDKLTKEGSYAAANGKVEIKNNAGDVAFTITGLNTDATDLGDTQKLVDAGLGKTVTDSILSVNDKVGSLSDDINKVGAGAAALAALRPEGFDPDDKWSFAVGYGHYKNANAGALGAFFKPNADTTVSLGGTIGNGDPMMNAGVSFKIGNRGKKAGTYRNAVELVRRVDGLEATMTKEVKRNDIQDSRLNAQEKKIAELGKR